MGNFLKQWLQKRKERKQQKESLRNLSELARTQRTIMQLQQSGMVTWNGKARQLLITESLARLMMRNADSWTAFIRRLADYEQYRMAATAWEEFFKQEELKAVRDAMKQAEQQNCGATSPYLTREDIDRIRRARRAEIVQEDMQPPRLQEFMIVIIPDSTEAHPEPIAVGSFDPETGGMEMALWSEVAAQMNRQ